ncbi:MAG: PepSY-associated TM helix domain-containing protein [Azoarcus sp.]|nr:PepSY-associated TM helix domain-containing protein [Azoarcus sp.]
MTIADPHAAARRQARRSSWLKTLHQWHWISSALCLLGMLLFAFTGITLNHAGDIEAKPVITTAEARLPTALLASLVKIAGTEGNDAPSSFPVETRDWLRTELAIPVLYGEVEWSADEAYLAMPRPGGDAWLRIDLTDGAVEYEHTDRGWISYLNDLHKGRHAGTAWSWFIDVFSAACIVFSLTGLFILQMHAANRPMVWPTVGLGVVIPVVLAMLFVH